MSTGTSSGSPSRKYVVLEQQTFEDSADLYYTKVGVVDSRNSTNALRKAFRELRMDKGYENSETTLLVIPQSMWRPTPVRAAVREQISVSVG